MVTDKYMEVSDIDGEGKTCFHPIVMPSCYSTRNHIYLS